MFLCTLVMVCKAHKCQSFCISFVLMMYVLVLVFVQLNMIFLYFMFSKFSNISTQNVKFFRVLQWRSWVEASGTRSLVLLPLPLTLLLLLLSNFLFLTLTLPSFFHINHLCVQICWALAPHLGLILLCSLVPNIRYLLLIMLKGIL